MPREGYEQRESSTTSPLIAQRKSTGSAASNSPATHKWSPGFANVASDVGIGQQPQGRRHIGDVKVGQLCPSAGPHTVVDAPGGNQNMMPRREGSGSGRDGELIVVSGIGQAWSSSD